MSPTPVSLPPGSFPCTSTAKDWPARTDSDVRGETISAVRLKLRGESVGPGRARSEQPIRPIASKAVVQAALMNALSVLQVAGSAGRDERRPSPRVGSYRPRHR